MASLTADPGILEMTGEAIREEFGATRMRAEWTWVATDDSGDVVGRALWWGRDRTEPIALDVLDVAGPSESRAGVATALLRAGHEALITQGWSVPLPHTIRLPLNWRGNPDCVAAVTWRQQAARDSGLTQVNERLQFEWTPTSRIARPHRARVKFRIGRDEEFLDLFSLVAAGSLDVMTQRTLAIAAAEELAKDELAYYLACSGERDWWRIAIDPSGDTVGFAIPSATPSSRNVGYVGTLPSHRGHGYVDDLLLYVTNFHQSQGITRITATTDATNHPMVDAFIRCGYRKVETRLDLEPHVSGAADQSWSYSTLGPSTKRRPCVDRTGIPCDTTGARRSASRLLLVDVPQSTMGWTGLFRLVATVSSTYRRREHHRLVRYRIVLEVHGQLLCSSARWAPASSAGTSVASQRRRGGPSSGRSNGVSQNSRRRRTRTPSVCGQHSTVPSKRASRSVHDGAGRITSACSPRRVTCWVDRSTAGIGPSRGVNRNVTWR